MIARFQAFFSTPARQAFGWAGLGISGVVFAVLGLWLLSDDGSNSLATSNGATATITPTASATNTSTSTSTPSPSPSSTETATPSPTTRAQQGGTGGGGGSAAPTPVPPTPTPTEPPLTAGGPYCPNVSAGTSPPSSVIGIFTIGGSDAPAGSIVGLAFDGVIGPTRASTAAGGYRVDYAAAGSDCANRVGAAIAVVYEGVLYPTGHTVGDSPGGPVVFTLAVP